MVPPKKKDPRGQQDTFSQKELEKIFSPDFYHLNERHPHQFWLPFLGLHTGARLEEICKLKTSDIEMFEGYWVFRIEFDDEEEEPDLKNIHAVRHIPMHKILIEDLRFPEFVEHMRKQGHDRIFPELAKQNYKFSHHISRWFRKYRNKTGVTAPPRRKTFHSFRHTANDHLYKKLVPETVLEELAGRTGKTESTKRYAKGHYVKTMYKEAIEKLDFNIDLSHLKNSKYVISD